MKIFGHPIHIMLIHFPSALFPMDLLCSFLGYYKHDPAFYDASFFAMAGGIAMGWLAVITGTLDLAGLVEDKPLAVKKALIHGSINTTVLIGYSVLAYIAFKKYPDLARNTPPELIFKGCLVAVLIVGNYLGGSLILKDRVGVKN